MDKYSVLRKYFGYGEFRQGQEKIIDAILQGRDAFGIMPTGAGKSVCFQVPAMLLKGVTIVISPLISLMKDQVSALESCGIPSVYINTAMTEREFANAVYKIVRGDVKLIYVAPERLFTSTFSSLCKKINVSLVAVDEAHCVSQWGQDFRPGYLKIKDFIDSFEHRPVLCAFTATATPKVRQDVEKLLELDNPETVVTSFDRKNLYFEVVKPQDKRVAVKRYLDLYTGKSGIVYCSSRKCVDELYEYLKHEKYPVVKYHAGMPKNQRAENQELFSKDKKEIIIATNAFGMGIDKPDVRFVVHFDVPDSPEAYFQEAGRGGRDGKRSFAVLLWNATDIQRLRQIATVSFPSLEYIEDIYHKVHIFYDIPYDTGAGRQLKFDLEEFCRHFKLQRQAVYYSLVYIERTGHWTLSEDVDISTKVQIMADRNDLYDLDLPEPAMVRLLEILMRRYTGLFSYPVPIDEDYVAGQIGVGVPMFRQLLYRLSLEHVIRYVPNDHATVLFLHHERLRPKNINLDPERYEFLKKSAEDRIGKMVDYVSEEDVCRSSFLLDYFGQTDSNDCGTCDICRSSKKKAAGQKDPTADVTSFINEEKSGCYTIDEITRRFASPEYGESCALVEILRALIDEGTVPPPSI